MPLSEEYKRQIKESLDLDEGGRLRAIAQKAAAVNAPVLIVGLGGTGVDALLITKKLIYDTIESEDKSDGYADKPKNIEYLAIDTDERYANRSYQGMRLNQRAGELMIYTRPDVTPILKHPEMQPPYIQSWLNTEIETTTVINGAGAVRQLGRLMLMGNLGQLQQILESKIRSALNEFPGDIPMYVFILAGISGGTGSGTFLDIPYMIKTVANQISAGRVIRNIGILFMPDVNAGRTGVDDNKRKSIYANGYAALKELDYLMNIENVGDRFEQTYGNLKVGKTGDSPFPPYDVCLMMSSKDRRGAQVGVGEENYQTVIQVAAETIFNFVLGDDGVTELADFSIQSFLSNETDNKNTYRTELANQRRPVTYIYSIAGASSAKLPIDDIMSYLTYKAFLEIEKYWNQRPNDADVDKVMAYFKLTKKGMEQAAKMKVRFADLSRLDHKAIKDSPGVAVQLCEAARKKQETVITANISEMAKTLETQIGQKDNIINQYFLELSKGPVFAQQCLYSANSQVKCVINELQRMANAFRSDIRDPEQMEAMSQNAARALNQIRNGKTIFGKGKDRDSYIEAVEKLYQAHFQNLLYEQLAQYCQNAAHMLLKENNRIYGIVAELMENLVPLFQKYGAIKTDAVRTKHSGGETLSWSLVNTPDFIREVERRIDTNPEFRVDMQEIIADFYHYLFENTELWAGDRNDVVENINGFIYRKFNKILDHSMDFFMTLIADSEGKTLTRYCDDIINKLRTKAEVRFPVDNVFANAAVPRPGYSFISVPGNSPQLFSAAQRVAAASVTAGAKKSIVKQSGIKDRIFMMNFESATPLSLYSDLKIFYETYKLHRNKKGLHLFEPNVYSNIDWEKLPSPYPETEWSGFEDLVEHQRNEGYRELLGRALKYGYVTVEPLSGKMICRWGAKVDCQPVLAKYKIEPFAETSISANAARRALREINAQLKGEGLAARLTEEFVRTDMVTDEAHTELKQDYMEMTFIQLFKPREEIRAMVDNHEECRRVLEDIKKRMIDDTAVENFVLCRILGLIKKNKLQYIYFDRNEVARTFTELSAKQAAYSEHYLLEEYMRLEEKIRTNLEERANGIIKAAAVEDIRIKWEKYRAAMIGEKLADLKLDWDEIDNGEKLLSSYLVLKEAVDNLENIFRGGSDSDDDEF